MMEGQGGTRIPHQVLPLGQEAQTVTNSSDKNDQGLCAIHMYINLTAQMN